MKAKEYTNPWLISVVTFLGSCMAGIDTGVINVALPTITNLFNVNLSTAQWTVTGFLLALCALLPICGRFSDLYTKRRIYLLGLAVFTISSFFCSFSTTISQLIIFRVIQGIGGAMVMANSQAIIAMNFPSEKLGRALGINSMAISLGMILGPSVGGFLIAAFSWHAIFLINIPIGIIGFYFSYKSLPRNESIKKYESFDVLGTILFILGLNIILIAMSNGFSWQWSIGKIIAFCFLGIVVLLFFLLWEKKAQAPIIDLSIFKNLDYLLGNVSVFLTYISLSTNNLLLPFAFQDVFHFSPAITGVFLFIPPMFIVVMAPLSGYCSDFIDKAILVIVGLILITIAMLIEAFIQVGNSLFAIVIAQALLGIGLGIFMSPNNSSTLSTVPKTKLGIAASINSLICNCGKIFGTSIAAILCVEIQRHLMDVSHLTKNAAFIISFKFSFIIVSVLTFISVIFTIKRLAVFKK